MEQFRHPLSRIIHEINSKRNARFWLFVHGSPVKLTLKPGQTINHCAGGPTDEGYSYETTQLTHEIDQIKWVAGSIGRDCDGGHEHFKESSCEPHLLRDREIKDYDFGFPIWSDGESSQRDQFAEAAGY